MEKSVPKRRHIKFRRRGITQKKAYKKIIIIIIIIIIVVIIIISEKCLSWQSPFFHRERSGKVQSEEDYLFMNGTSDSK